ncbi:MAG: tRNA preQ1(34) S-adenosylmethionine ribosyltransferase-isomerase QueA [Candidatus Eremiobacteraeota bacterium]|nr:tRNA preQ1(34) S-adenosylmethionine ribosyltransferase-isomerase QueA [Candidatus Eremiobacteraeota bacterium]
MATDEGLTEAYDFDLPQALIAQSHSRPRDASRLLVMRDGLLEDARFSGLPRYLRAGDLLVLNETRVIAARLFGIREGSGGAVEVLLLRPAAQQRYDARALRWQALVKPGRRLRTGMRILFGSDASALVAADLHEGVRELEFTLTVPFEQFLERAGRLPLPPYIKNESQEAQEDYQTIFAREPGSVAAPTASLHFTDAVMNELAEGGVQLVRLTLDIGLGTFRPMKGNRLSEHHMHAESFAVPAKTAEAVARAKAEGRRVIASGTTVMRALEGSAAKHGVVRAGEDETDIFITPGFSFRIVDALITNFHLPQSTLLVLVSAFAGREAILHAYQTAVERGYRFFSFGDAMFIEP